MASRARDKSPGRQKQQQQQQQHVQHVESEARNPWKPATLLIISLVFIALLVGIFILGFRLGFHFGVKWGDYECDPKLMSLVRRGDNAQSLSDIQTLLLKYGERCSCYELEWWLWIPVVWTTPLYAAVESGRTAIVKELLKHTPSLNDGRWGWVISETPLYAAARQGHVSAVKELLENSTVNVNKGLEEWLYACEWSYLGVYRTETPLYAGESIFSTGASTTFSGIDVVAGFLGWRTPGLLFFGWRKSLLYAAVAGAVSQGDHVVTEHVLRMHKQSYNKFGSVVSDPCKSVDEGYKTLVMLLGVYHKDPLCEAITNANVTAEVLEVLMNAGAHIFQNNCGWLSPFTDRFFFWKRGTAADLAEFHDPLNDMSSPMTCHSVGKVKIGVINNFKQRNQNTNLVPLIGSLWGELNYKRNCNGYPINATVW